MTETRVAIVGAGALGCYFTAILTRAGARVILIARGRHLETVRRDGILLDDLERTHRVAPEGVTDRPADVGPVDAVVLAVKAWQVPEAAAQIRPLVASGTRVLPLQNGIESWDELVRALGEEAPLMGLCRVACALVAPGHVRHIAIVPTVVMGERDGAGLSGNAAALAAALQSAGVVVENPENMRVALWEKLIFIAGVSGAGAVARANVGEMRASAPTRELIRRIATEVRDVGRASGVPLADDSVARVMAFVDSMAPASTASMQRDIADGRPSELEAIIGAVVRLGAAAGIAAPATGFVYASLLPQERRARSGL
ncbi:MAG: ketopantoate reductase family protein [Bacteroidota bacterium]